MSNRASKIFFALLGLGLIGILVFFYTSFNGNPIKVYLTRGQVKNYLESKYPDVEFTNVSGFYNFKSNSYGGRALAHTVPAVQVFVNQYRKGVFTDNIIEAKLEAQAKAEVIPLASAMFPDKEFTVMLKFDNDSLGYPISTDFSKELPLELLVDVRWSGPVVTKDEFIDEVLTIHAGLQDLGYDLQSHFFSYSFPPEPEAYLLSIGDGEDFPSREALLEAVHHMKK